MVVNLFTGRSTEAFSNLPYTDGISLTWNDPAYYAVRSYAEKRGPNPFSGAFEDPYKPISDEGWSKVDITDPAEFRFLTKLGLTAEKEDGAYVHHLAYLLYSPDGLFANYDGDDAPAERKERLASFMQLLLSYTLPGQWWRLKQQQQKSRSIDRELSEIQRYWAEIASEYGAPLEKDAEPDA